MPSPAFSSVPAVRVLVAEDSPTARALLTSLLHSDPGLRVVGSASDGPQAVALAAALRPDVITMDVRMPGFDGFEATRRIMAATPTPIVIVSGHYDPHDVEVSMHALRAGALTILPKPPGPGAADFETQRAWLIRTVKAMAGVKVVRQRMERRDPPLVPPPPRAVQAPRAIALAASTGGPAALARILSDLPVSFPLPLLVVQHIARGFADGLARWLATVSPLRVHTVGGRERLAPATVYVAPDDRHLVLVDPGTVGITSTPPVDGFRPSASVLFESAALAFGHALVAVILTGMGDDGVAGLQQVRAAGGRVIAQDEETCVVFGMPGAAVGAGVVDAVLPLGAIAQHLRELAA